MRRAWGELTMPTQQLAPSAARLIVGDLLFEGGCHELVEEPAGGRQAHTGMPTSHPHQRGRELVSKGVQQQLHLLPVILDAEDLPAPPAARSATASASSPGPAAVTRTRTVEAVR